MLTLGDLVLQLVELLLGEGSRHLGFVVRQPSSEAGLVVHCLLLEQQDHLGILDQFFEAQAQAFG
jgi:hypothetical protein